MKKPIVNARGQVVIPAELRRKLGIKKGTPVSIKEQNGEIVMQPMTDRYLRSMAGILGTNGKLLKALREEKTREREL